MNRRTCNGYILLLVATTSLLCYALWPREPSTQDPNLTRLLRELVALTREHASAQEDEVRRQDWESRHQNAASALRELGPKALPHLLRNLQSHPMPSRFVEGVNRLLEKQSLLNLRLKPSDEEVAERMAKVEQAIAGFAALGPAASPALPELTRLLRKPAFCREATRCLVLIGPSALSALASALTNSHREVQYAVAAGLADLGTPAIPALASAVTNAYPAVQNQAVNGLATLASRSVEASLLPALMNAATNSNCQFQAQALFSLGDLKLIARPSTPWLESVMHDPLNPLAGVAMRVVAEISESHERLVPFFAERLSNTNLAPDAAFALALAGPKGVPPLLRAVTNDNPLIRGASLEALRHMYRENKTSDLRRPSGYRFTSLSRLYDLRSPITLQPTSISAQLMAAHRTGLRLAEALDHPDPEVRLLIVQILRLYGRYGIPGLSRAVTDVDGAVRASAQTAVAGLSVELSEGAIVRGPKDRKQIALVFTGHEHGENGEALLDELARHKAEASFFLTGAFLSNTNLIPIVQRLYREGHYLGAHSDENLLYCPWEEPKKTSITREKFESDFKDNLISISRFGNVGSLPSYFMAPYARHTPDIVEWVADFFYFTIGPTPGVSPIARHPVEGPPNLSFSRSSFDSILAREQQDPHGLNGLILLFQLSPKPEETEKTPWQFGDLLDLLTAKGYRFVAVDELFDPKAAQGRRNLIEPKTVTAESRTPEQFRKRYGLPP